MEGNFSLIRERDDLQDIFTKYGAFALEKQGCLAKVVGDTEPELDIEKGIVSFDDKEFPIQLIGFLNPQTSEWSWAWDNDEIGFPEDLLKEAKAAKEFGEEYGIPQFTESRMELGLGEAHILVMTLSSIFGNDAYCAPIFGDFIFFVTIESDEIPISDDVFEFMDTYYDFYTKFEVDHRTALKGYADLKGYGFSDHDDFSFVKMGEDRFMVSFSERGNVVNLKPFKVK